MDQKKIGILGAVLLIFDDISYERGHPPLFECDKTLLLHCYTISYIYPLILSKISRNVHIRIKNFSEIWVNKYLAYDFYQHFRMLRGTFKILLDTINPFFIRRNQGGATPIPLEKGLLLTLWFLAKGDSMFSVADRFNVAHSTACILIHDVCRCICELDVNIIKWPANKNECKTIAKDFQKLCGFPDVVGAIDCCHISLKVPADQSDSYLDRKFNYSVILQAVCTSQKLFTNVFIGFPGAAHDARVLKESSLFKIVEEKGEQTLFFNNYHLLGDSAYPCKKWLITPYRKSTTLSPVQKNFNIRLSTTRVKIENAFGLLTGRWLILKYVNVNSIERAINIITSCCILHNFCLLQKDYLEIDYESFFFASSVNKQQIQDDRAGLIKRNRLSVQLYEDLPSHKKIEK